MKHDTRPGISTLGAQDLPTGNRVRAIRMGFYDNARRRPGDVFDLLAPSDFEAAWMMPVPVTTGLRATSAQQALNQEIAGLNPLAGRNAPKPTREVVHGVGRALTDGDPVFDTED